jgi:site-specific recombinase XerD
LKSQTLPAGRSISSGELYALLSAVGRSVADVRDAAIITILYSTGMRRSELVGLDLADYDADPGELRILHAKGNKQRTAPIVNGAAAALADWLAIRGNWAGPLFCPVFRSGHIKQSRLTTQAVYHIARKRAQLAGIEKSMSPHDFRRTVIGDLLDRGADIVTVQKLVGHSKTETTARYDRRPDAAKRWAVNLLHVPYSSKLTD